MRIRVHRLFIPLFGAWLLLAPAAAIAGPLEDARAMADEGRTLMDAAAKVRGDKKADLIAQGLRKYARAYNMITDRKLQNDAPDLLKDIGARIEQGNASVEVMNLRRGLMTKAMDATVEGKLTEAYDHLASLRDLDPRDLTVEYAMSVIGQRMKQ
jgi:hypothetical protein